ncbi:MAG: hypothetical protein Q4G04_04445 [bacterium]|nr:hypothetical protein [bacterium]
MKLINSRTIIKIVITILISILLIVPFYQLGIEIVNFTINGKIIVELKYILAGVLFIIGSIICIYDEFYSKDNNFFIEFISTKILIDTVLVILTSVNMINPIITIAVIVRDIVVDAVNVIVVREGYFIKRNILSKTKMVMIIIGIILTLFYNLPFEMLNLRISDFILIVGAVMSIVSAVQYYNINKKILQSNKLNKISTN